MSASRVIFAVSMALNAGVVGVFALRPSLAPEIVRNAFHREPPPAVAPARVTSAPKRTAPRTLWPMLATDDLPTLIARLRAAGFPASVIREVVRAEVSARYDPRLRAFTDPNPNTPYWKTPAHSLRYGSAGWEEYSRLQRERARVLRELLADPFFASDDVSATQRRQFGNLSRQKMDAVQRIEDDYADMLSAIRASAHGVLLAEDREKIAFLEREKRADLASVLTAEELADYQLRASPLTRMLAGELGEFRPSEAEFRAVFAMHEAINRRVPSTAAGGHSHERHTVQRELEAQLRTQLGEARYRDYIRETSSDFHLLRRMAARDNLPPDAAPRAFDVRYTVERESMRIYNDAAMTVDDKRAALAALAQKARNEMLALLGPAAGPSYVATVENQWLRPLERGVAISFDGGPSRGFGSDNVVVWFGVGARFHNLPSPTPPPRP